MASHRHGGTVASGEIDPAEPRLSGTLFGGWFVGIACQIAAAMLLGMRLPASVASE